MGRRRIALSLVLASGGLHASSAPDDPTLNREPAKPTTKPAAEREEKNDDE